MTDRAEIERLLNMTGRTLEGLPTETEYLDLKNYDAHCKEVDRCLSESGFKLSYPCLFHQSDVIELLVGALRDTLDKPMQKPLTLEEANRASWVYFEEKDNGPIKHDIWPCVIWSRGPGYSFVDIDHLYRKMIYFKTDDYGVVWRCWASRPTDEERSAAAWES